MKEPEIVFSWNNEGFVKSNIRRPGKTEDSAMEEHLRCLASVALVDHALSTLETTIAVELAKILAYGIKNTFTIKAIDPNLVSAKIILKPDVKTRRISHTIFEPVFQRGTNNSQAQEAVKQLTANYVASLLRTVIDQNAIGIKVGILDWLVFYNATIQMYFAGELTASRAKAALVKTLSSFISEWPHAYFTDPNALTLREAAIEKLVKDWENLPTTPGLPFWLSSPNRSKLS